MNIQNLTNDQLLAAAAIAILNNATANELTGIAIALHDRGLLDTILNAMSPAAQRELLTILESQLAAA